MINLTIIKLNLALKVEAPPKPTIESSVNEKKFYEDWEYFNSCRLMIVENHMEDSIYASISKIENAKDFLYAISKKYTKFSKNGKKELYDNHWVNVCFESNIIDVSSNTWRLDSGATIHTYNSTQAVISKRSLTGLEQYVYMGDGKVKLDRLRYSFLFGTRKVKLYQDSILIGTGVLCGNLYRLELSTLPFVFAILTVNTASSSKCLRLNEKSSII